MFFCLFVFLAFSGGKNSLVARMINMKITPNECASFSSTTTRCWLQRCGRLLWAPCQNIMPGTKTWICPHRQILHSLKAIETAHWSTLAGAQLKAPAVAGLTEGQLVWHPLTVCSWLSEQLDPPVKWPSPWTFQEHFQIGHKSGPLANRWIILCTTPHTHSSLFQLQAKTHFGCCSKNWKHMPSELKS